MNDAAESEDAEISGINITPLVDVALTLVLVFMVTLPLSAIHGINVRRQILERYGLSTPQENIVVHLAANGLFVSDKKGKEKKIPTEQFGSVLSQMIQDSSGK